MATLVHDRALKEMRVQDPDTEAEVVELYSQSRDYESRLTNMDLSHLVQAGGKEPLGQVLGNDVFVGITLVLLDDWHVGWEDQAGPSLTVLEIKGGNTLAQLEPFTEPDPTFQNPIAATANATITRTNSSSATIIEVNDVDNTLRILEMWRLLGLDIANPLVITKVAQDAGAGISQTITGDGENLSTVTRNP